MKLLLCKNVDKLGIVGDVVNVSDGYARNYLLPSRLATEPTDANVRALADARRVAELERARHMAELEEVAQKLQDVEVTIRAKANEEGVLFGSVGPREIALALEEEGFPVDPEKILLSRPIRHLDNVTVEIKIGGELRSSIKVWVVRDKTEGEEPEEEVHRTPESSAGMEAAPRDHNPDE